MGVITRVITMKINFLSAQIHKWIGIVIGVQVVLWIAGGFVMTVFPIEEIRSEHNIREVAPQPILASEVAMPLADALASLDGRQPVGVEVGRFLDQVVYRLQYGEEDFAMVDAVTGEVISPISADMALEVARRDFAGEANLDGATLITEHNVEYRAELPVWRIDMNDAEGTHLYVLPDTGQVRARRSDIWRVYDFFWMLHIMDYENRTDFNNPLVIWASLISLVLAISGIVLLFYRFSKKDIRWLTRKKA